MDVDVIKAKQIPFKYVSPPVCDFIFSATGESEIFLNLRTPAAKVVGLTATDTTLSWDSYEGALCYTVYKFDQDAGPAGGYLIVAECIADTEYVVEETGEFSVTAVTINGETDFSDKVEVELV